MSDTPKPPHQSTAWQPFASAPVDGRTILAFRADAGVFAAHYVPAYVFEARDDAEECCWFTTAGEDLTDDLPTHWMPLPEPPQ